MPKTSLKRKNKKAQPPGPFRDILETARLLSSSEVPEKVIEAVLSHLCERLGKRARCALLQGKDLKVRFWSGEHTCPVNGIKIRKDSIVWEVAKTDKPVNLTDPHQSNGYKHSLDTPINVKSIIPLSYVDPLSRQRKRFGVLIVDSGKEDVPISADDFEYLQVIGELISAIVGRTDLVRQLMASCHRQEAILMEAAHNFRNSIAIIGGFARRIAKLAKDTTLAENATILQEEVETLEKYFAQFETSMNIAP